MSRWPIYRLWCRCRSAIRGDHCDDDDNELAAATTTTTSSLRRRRRQRDRPWVTGFGFGLCIGDFFLINTSVLCIWFAEFYVWFAFVLGFDLSASDDATWWVQFLILYIFFFIFFIENPWACRERATCNGLVVCFACCGLGFVIYIYIYIYFFSDFSSNFFLGFFFFFFSWK